MKCLSLTQPWASLVIMGIKQYETRGWSTKHRGPLLIHAAKGTAPAVKEAIANDSRMLMAVIRAGLIPQVFLPAARAQWMQWIKLQPRGVILGSVQLYGCYRVPSQDVQMVDLGSDIPPGVQPAPWADPIERHLGDYTPGRWAWLMSSAVQLFDPIPYRGHLGLFDVPDSLLDGQMGFWVRDHTRTGIAVITGGQ